MALQIELSQRTLAGIGATVPVPGYDRAAVRVGIVHLGVGGSTGRTRPRTWMS